MIEYMYVEYYKYLGNRASHTHLSLLNNQIKLECISFIIQYKNYFHCFFIWLDIFSQQSCSHFWNTLYNKNSIDNTSNKSKKNKKNNNNSINKKITISMIRNGHKSAKCYLRVSYIIFSDLNVFFGLKCYTTFPFEFFQRS